MAFVQHCENCGLKVEIEDTDNLEFSVERKEEMETESQKPTLCSNCTQQQIQPII
ncbi:hypothetical protein Lbir_2123 [Legionella birminghamensis]|uniref:Uncharacterized protein n=1 Tax=Legionella birminghamensis TaxID=28083 RepID=A0A378I8V8_9GAMM|nr:hypothetical protein [Legionella birminghamensis]KTC69384.1 hypothetical protein Lbir_2123 [Legionella birminghamensis]STX31647.1 Uncharacterised protein [Legionella birminghamensis]